ncbi:hypothetical protein CUD01_23350 [Cellulomonas uda]|uniref:Uncharacterized protein n=1 Tax=Cellulomonas uda TaxID=1714 RepID=A0A4Y3KBR3_CELUD|nr:hypothetical protein CUD01_23350 [Cellulomonas uda]
MRLGRGSLVTPALTAALILATPTMSPASELVDPVKDRINITGTLKRYMEYRAWKSHQDPLADYAYGAHVPYESVRLRHRRGDVAGGVHVGLR